MDRVERRLKAYYEAEARDRLRPALRADRRAACERFARLLDVEQRRVVLDVGAGPASDHAPFSKLGIRYVGVDLAVGNAVLAAEADQLVVPASLFALPFRSASFPAGWSMSTLQHVPDERIDEALAELVRVLQPGSPVAIGMWGGRDEVVEPPTSPTGVELPRLFVLRTHERIDTILGRHLDIERSETWPSGPSGWSYHLAWGRSPLAASGGELASRR